jgi:hypothetical protein
MKEYLGLDSKDKTLTLATNLDEFKLKDFQHKN